MINPNIPLSAQVPKTSLGPFMNAVNFQDRRRSQGIADRTNLQNQIFQKQRVERENRKRGVLSDLMKSNIRITPEGPTLDKKGFLSGMMDQGLTEEAVKYSQQLEKEEAEKQQNFLNTQKIKQQAKQDILKTEMPILRGLKDTKERARVLRDAYKQWQMDPSGLPDEITDDMLNAWEQEADSNIAGQIYFSDGQPYLASRDPNNPTAIPITTAEGGRAPKADYKLKPSQIEVDGQQIQGGFDPRTAKIIPSQIAGDKPLSQRPVVQPGGTSLKKKDLELKTLANERAQNKEWREQQEFQSKLNKQGMSVENAVSDVAELRGLAKSIAENKDLWRATGFVGALPDMPGSGAADVRADIETLMSRAALNTMMQLKQASATGATGFGALSERELNVAINAFETLQSTQSPSKFRKAMYDIIESMDKLEGFLKRGGKKPESGEGPRRKATMDDF